MEEGIASLYSVSLHLISIIGQTIKKSLTFRPVITLSIAGPIPYFSIILTNSVQFVHQRVFRLWVQHQWIMVLDVI